MSRKWTDRDAWDDTCDTPRTTDGTHTCRSCGHGATIETPHYRTEHFCTSCETWRRFVSVHAEDT